MARIVLTLSLVSMVVIALVACAQSATPTPVPTKGVVAPPAAKPSPAAQPTPTAGSQAAPKATAVPNTTAPPTAVKPLSPAVTAKTGILGNTADVGVFIALERGYFKDEGLDVQLVTFVSGAEVIPPLATGELSFGSGSINPGFFNAVARGIDLKIVADKSKVSPQMAGGGLMVRKDAYDSGQYKDLAQLKGKAIAINQKATTSEMYVDKILQKSGVNLGDVKLVEMPFPDELAALSNKSVDAIWTVEPFITIGAQRGMATMLFPMWDVYPDHFTNVMIISPVFAKQQPEASKRFITAHLRGQRDFYNAYVKKTAPMEPIVGIITKYTATKDPSMVQKMKMGAVDPNGYIKAEFLANDQEYYSKRGWVPQKVDTSKLVDFQYVEYALQRLGKIN